MIIVPRTAAGKYPVTSIAPVSSGASWSASLAGVASGYYCPRSLCRYRNMHRSNSVCVSGAYAVSLYCSVTGPVRHSH